MNKLVIAVLAVLVVLVAGLGLLVWRADEHARRDAERHRCIQRVEATAMIALLAPASHVDAEGRLDAMATLGAQLDDC